MILLLAFVFGAALGSFAQVVATRLHVASFVNSRSKCLSCSHILSWKDMMPLASCLLLKGKCRYCKVSFGYQSAVIEFCFGLIFTLNVYRFLFHYDFFEMKSVLHFLFHTGIMMTLGIIVIYDLRQKIIPRAFLYLFLFLSLFPLVHHFLMTKNYVDLASPLFVALPYFILFLITMGRGVGFGDVLLYAGVGAILGTDRGVLAFLMSLWVGTLVVIPLLLFRFVKKESAIPFAPFIVCGYFIVLFTQYGISDLVTYVYRAMLTI